MVHQYVRQMYLTYTGFKKTTQNSLRTTVSTASKHWQRVRKFVFAHDEVTEDDINHIHAEFYTAVHVRNEAKRRDLGCVEMRLDGRLLVVHSEAHSTTRGICIK